MPRLTFINKNKYEATECMPLESDVSLKYYAHSPELIVFKYSFYIYEGGAHGYGASRYLTFMRKDAASGEFEGTCLATTPTRC